MYRLDWRGLSGWEIIPISLAFPHELHFHLHDQLDWSLCLSQMLSKMVVVAGGVG